MDQESEPVIETETPRDKWYNVIFKYRGLAIQCGYRFAMKHHVHMDEYITEAQYHLCMWSLWIVGKDRPEDFKYEQSLIRFVFMRLSRYKMKSRDVCATDILGPEWEDRYALYTGALSTQRSIAMLFNELVDNDDELAVLIMFSKGFDQREISKELQLSLPLVGKILARIRSRLEKP